MQRHENAGGRAPPQDSATRAFEGLRAEVTVMRQTVESLPAALEGQRPPDYTTTLGQIARELAGVSQRLGIIEQQPALKLTPEQHGRAVASAGADIVRDAVSALDSQASEMKRERHQLATLIGSLRGQEEQRKWLIWTGAVCLVVGLVLFPLLGNILPDSLSTRMSALTMGADRWNAGQAMMMADSPSSWNYVAQAASLVDSNSEALNACRSQARQTGEAQSCTITVEPDG